MKDRLLNILLIALVVLLTLNLFTQKKEEALPNDTIEFSTQKSYTIPAAVKLTLKNHTPGDLTLNTCEHISLKKDGNDFSPSKCEDLTLKANQTQMIDLSADFKNFQKTWNYYATLDFNGKQYLAPFEIENRGVIGKLFVYIFYAPIYNLMAFLLEITSYSLGWAIVLVTLIIRLVLLIPQHKMMLSQARMQQIQPKIKEIQDKHKGNHQLLGMELMKLYKDEWVSPLGSCGMLLIQMPILIVIYRVILWIQDTSNTYYLYSFLWDYDMTHIISNFYGIDLFGIGGWMGIALALLIGLLQFIQVKLSLYFQEQKNGAPKVIEKKKDSNDFASLMPDPNMLNKFMLYGMPIMIAIAVYTFYAWVGLYWGIGTLFMIFQQLFVNKILKK